jgi:hypothetical protein
MPWLNDKTSIQSSCLSSNDSPGIPSTFRNILLPPPLVVVLVTCGSTMPLLGGFSSVGGGDGIGIGGAGGGAGEGAASGFMGGCVGVTGVCGITGVSLGVAGSVGSTGDGEGKLMQATNKITILRNIDRNRAVILFRRIKRSVDMTNLLIVFITGSFNYMLIVQTVNSYLVRWDGAGGLGLVNSQLVSDFFK